MRLLLDTQLLLWAAGLPGRLSDEARGLLGAPENSLHFSAASLWEIVIKRGLDRDDFQVDPHRLHRGLLDNGYQPLAIAGSHTLMVGNLPPIHKDPFDRILIAQAMVEGLTLLTTDGLIAQYPGPIRKL
ncbi:type II toxin-antitoxin system VapC family toxin [Thiohalocapsa marina]|uniref:Type II toxin-antitoxin system VapC family toxin n=1 Tax=Thiohalocapsa marina TaxID=424902 RepID=A0A5M8FQT5_9GAMM|nr:type II toxin-antitoxin system VapC family toxin [Thiohalocapsa marina]KAA6186266.1 type II toxin-antitoxin system VapC family toxin [Thiohalocapsa marina]